MAAPNATPRYLKQPLHFNTQLGYHPALKFQNHTRQSPTLRSTLMLLRLPLRLILGKASLIPLDYFQPGPRLELQLGFLAPKR